MTKACPMCGKPFICNSGDIENCQCSKLELPKDLYQYIATKYQDCLCLECLKELLNKRTSIN